MIEFPDAHMDKKGHDGGALQQCGRYQARHSRPSQNLPHPIGRQPSQRQIAEHQKIARRDDIQERNNTAKTPLRGSIGYKSIPVG